MSHTISLEINKRPLTIEIGKIGKQADGSALVRYGDTVMLVTATSRKEMKEEKSFLPLIVDYKENTYAAGKIPGGFFKREGKPTEREILISRLIDRPIRPLFPEGYYFDTQIIGLLMSADLENEPDTMGVIGASAALYFSDIPFTIPLGAVKVGIIANNELVVNPTQSELEESPLNMTVVSTEDGIIMIEAGAREVEEEKILEGLSLAHEANQQIIRAQKALHAEIGVEKRAFTPKLLDEEKLARLEQEIGQALSETIEVKGKKASDAASKAVLDDYLTKIPEENEEERAEVKSLFYVLEEKLVRSLILDKGRRVDGRGFDDIRPISIEVGLLPRTHGSALFTRGETQSLATVTLGTTEDIQRLDGIGSESEKRFMLHYNFPPFSVGEVSFMRAPGRREIGHGALAEKSIQPAIPDDEAFPYTIRIVSDILESNGSSSMASVCGGILALMDAGVPLTMIVSGIAMGLVKEGDRHAILTDIAGLEDHFGDMDFKMSGSEKGITAIQLDLKIPCVTLPMLREIVTKSRDARLKVLAKMKEVLPAPRAEISAYAPRILTVYINPEKVSDVIGPAGKIIKRIISQTGAKIDIDESGRIIIASVDVSAAENAKQMIMDLTAEAEIGKTYTGKVVRVEEYGAFVEIMPNIVGLLHISEVAPYRIKSIHDVIKLGDTITVKVVNIDPADNKVRLSKKALEEDDSSRPSSPRPFRKFRKDRPSGPNKGYRSRY